MSIMRKTQRSVIRTLTDEKSGESLSCGTCYSDLSIEEIILEEAKQVRSEEWSGVELRNQNSEESARQQAGRAGEGE